MESFKKKHKNMFFCWFCNRLPTDASKNMYIFSFFLKIVASCYSKFVCFLFSSHFLALMFIEKILEKRFFSWILETPELWEFQKKTQKYVFLLILQSITYWCFKKYVYFFIFLKKSLHRVTLSLFVFCFFYTFWHLCLFTYYTRSKKRTKNVKKPLNSNSKTITIIYLQIYILYTINKKRTKKRKKWTLYFIVKNDFTMDTWIFKSSVTFGTLFVAMWYTFFDFGRCAPKIEISIFI